MTFPTIPLVADGRVLFQLNTNPAGTHTSDDLSGLTKNANDLLVAIVIIYDGNSTNAEFSGWTNGFTELPVGGDNAGTATMGIGVAYKISTGSETGTVAVTSADASANDSCFILLSIAGAHVSTAPEAGGFATGTTAAADPASFNPGAWATEDTLWIAVGGSGETATGGSFTGLASAPTNYTDYADSGISADVIGGVEGAVSFRQLNAASEDVGTYSVDVSNARNSALVIAIRPLPAPIVVTATDALTASEAISRLFQGARTTTDAISHSDAATRIGTFLRDVSDSISLTEIVNAAKIVLRNITDSITNSDAVTRTGTFIRSITDSNTFAESVTRTGTFLRGIADSIFLSDAATRIITSVRTTVDSVALGDVINRVLTAARVTADALSFSELVEGFKVILRSAADSLGLTDIATRVMTFGRAATDSILLSDTSQRVLSAIRSTTDTTVFSDVAEGFKVILRTAVDAIGLSDVANRAFVLFRTTVDSLAFSEVATGIRVILRTAVDSIGLSDVAARIISGITTVIQFGKSPILRSGSSLPRLKTAITSRRRR